MAATSKYFDRKAVSSFLSWPKILSLQWGKISNFGIISDDFVWSKNETCQAEANPQRTQVDKLNVFNMFLFWQWLFYFKEFFCPILRPYSVFAS